MGVLLLAVEEAALAQGGENLLSHGRRGGAAQDLAAGQPVEAGQVDTVLVQRGDDGQIELAPQGEVLRAATGSDVDDARAFFRADVAPGDDAVGIRLLGKGFNNLGQVIKRAGVLPANHVRALQAADDLVALADERVLHRPFGQIVRPAVLSPHLHVVEFGANRGGDVAGQRPGGRRPDKQGLIVAAEQRQAHENGVVGHVEVAIGDDLVLADGRAAAGAPGHDVVAFIDPAVVVALLQEAPDLVVVLVAKGEVGAAQFRHAQPGDDLLDRIGDRAARPLDGDDLVRVVIQQVGQAAQLVRVVPVHPVAQTDRLLSLHGSIAQDARLAELDELGQTHALDVALAGEAQLLLGVDFHP